MQGQIVNMPTALLLSASEPPARLSELGLNIQRFQPEGIRELDASTAHWVYFIPDTILDKPEWSSLRVELGQANRWFIVHGSDSPPAIIVRAMRDGAFDFVDAREPLSRWEEAFRKASTSQQLWLQLYGDRRSSGDTRLVGKSAAMQSVVRTIERIGPTPANVLIIGESGTGKEKAAQALHETSGLTGPFLPVNCAAIPRDLIESELFGSEKGAFTGAPWALTSSANSTGPSSQNSSVFWNRAAPGASAAVPSTTSMRASSPRPIAISRPASKATSSARTFITAYRKS
jgi:hypothetical protein